MTLKAFPCPFCGHHKTVVICGYNGRGKARKTHEKARYRRCVSCQKRFKTIQLLEPHIEQEKLAEYVNQKAYRQNLVLTGKWHSCKLKPAEVLAIKKEWAIAEYQDDQLAIDIAKKYGVKKLAILNITRGISWKAITIS